MQTVIDLSPPEQSEALEEARTERRRLRMRLAQRKHRARQEDILQRLRSQVASLQAAAETSERKNNELETNFRKLEARLLSATGHDSQIYVHVRSAIESFRRLTRLQPSPYREYELAQTCGGDTIQPLSVYHNTVNGFTQKLFDICIRLGVQLLTAHDATSHRLAKSSFRCNLPADCLPETSNEWITLRSCLQLWVQRLDDESRALTFARKRMTQPRAPGYDGFMSPADVEYFLRSNGWELHDDYAIMPIDQSSTVNHFNPSSQESTMKSVHKQPKPPYTVEYNDFDSVGTHVDPLTWHSMLEDVEETRSQTTMTFGFEHQDARKMIGLADLIKQLARTSVCMGGPGPGFLKNNINMVLDRIGAAICQPLTEVC